MQGGFRMNRIKELRKKKGVTVKNLAEIVGVSQSMLTNYENGSATPRNAKIWEELARYFDVSVAYISGFTETVETFMSAEEATNNLIPTFEYTPSTIDERDTFLFLHQLDQEDTQKVYDLIRELYFSEKYELQREEGIEIKVK